MKIFVVNIIFLTALFADSYPSLLFHGNCITCHDTKNEKSAPRIQKIKATYINAFPKKEDFVNYMSMWVYNPKVETSLMIDKVEKYGLMPHLAYDKTVLEQIAGYIYENDFDE